ncbi:uncharacterized protein LOC116346401 [Contarinia nasturtii]|uniref:uncharacterized protein LOC116346401 n=1 Tax=Contarinia nasturtii TaxID=265458 RepID=UPI0012D3DA12|nr:uncharacterized protein LOC116346401 [Contarinia nasturtii]XP_031632294.1 uncharacterized protein LOC116346401 [Contarinia nasturtii]
MTIKWITPTILLLSLVAVINCECNSTCIGKFVTNPHNRKVAESQLSAQIIALLEHYKQNDPCGIPGAPVPDPFSVPYSKQSLGMGTLIMKDTLAHGLSKFRIRKMGIDVNRLMVKAEIQLDVMYIIGNYTLSSLFSSTSGPFNVTLTNVTAKSNASVAVERDGKIRTQDIVMDMNFAGLTTDFKNLGFMGSIFQSLINTAPSLVFDTMKPFMLNEAYTKLRTEIDSKVNELMTDYKLPNSISPLDMAIGEARRKVREMNFDPFIIKDYNHSVGLFSIQLKNSWMSGVSGFYRVGDFGLSLDNNVVTIELNLGTQEIIGSTDWEVTVSKGIITRTGHIKFSIQYIQAKIVLSQMLDTRNQPQIKDLQLEMGNIQVRSDGAGLSDYVIEFVINILPNLLRYQIMDALENPAKTKIQDEMNKINVEKLIKDNIPNFEKLSQNYTITLDDLKY